MKTVDVAWIGTLKISIDRPHANCWHQWSLYDIQVVRCGA